MQGLELTTVSAIVGVVATLIVAKYFFRKSVAKQLTPYIQFAAPIFAGIDPDVRSQLKVFVRDVPVDDLYELQFVIVNTGERAIRDCIEPLRLTLPAGVTILDAAILHVHPQGRRIDLTMQQNEESAQIAFPFGLLNKNEGFVVKVLLRGGLTRRDLKFSIAVDDLPPILNAQSVAPPFKHRPRVYDFPIAVLVTIVYAVLGLTSIGGMLLLAKARPELFPYPWAGFKPTILELLFLALWFLSMLFFWVAVAYGVGQIVTAGRMRNLFPFPLPEHLKQAAPWLPHALFDDDDGVVEAEVIDGDGTDP